MLRSGCFRLPTAACLVAVIAVCVVRSEEQQGPGFTGPLDDSLAYGFFSTQEHGTCQHNVRMLWQTEVGSSVFAPPMISDVFSDGKKEVVVPTYTHFLEVLDGATGTDVKGWPYAHRKMNSQASPFRYDVEKDGTAEIAIATYDGEIIFFSQEGKPAAPVLNIGLLGRRVDFADPALPPPDLKAGDSADDGSPDGAKQPQAPGSRAAVQPSSAPVNRPNASRSGNASVVVASKPDALGDRLAQAIRADPLGRAQPLPVKVVSAADVPKSGVESTAHVNNPANEHALAAEGGHVPLAQGSARKLQQYDAPTPLPGDGGGDGADAGGGGPPLAHDGYYADDYYDDYGGFPEPAAQDVAVGSYPITGRLSAEAAASMDLLYHPDLFKTAFKHGTEAKTGGGGGDTIEMAPTDPFSIITAERIVATAPSMMNYFTLDPHILATPVVTDLDSDGLPDLVVPVTYFYRENDNSEEQEIRDRKQMALDALYDKKLPPPVQYVASSVVVIDMTTKKMKWRYDFPVTLKSAAKASYLLSSPMVVNIDQVGTLDVVVATGTGELYAFNHLGHVRRGFPVKDLGSALSGVLAEDISGDGQIDFCTAGAEGLVTCVDREGHTLWRRQLIGSVADGLVAGDVNADGFLDVVATTYERDTQTGLIVALDSRKGDILAGFPVNVTQGIVAGALLINLNNTDPPMSPSAANGLHIVVPALNGHLYVVSGTTGCISLVDLGHKTYASVVADDLTGNGRMDLVVATLSGHVIALSTAAPYHPLKSWPSKIQSMNGLTARAGHLGIYVEGSSRVPRDIIGEMFPIQFTILDDRLARRRSMHGSLYFVTVTIGTGLVVMAKLYTYPGTYMEYVPTPAESVYGTVTVTMQVATGQRFSDSYAVSFNMHFLDAAKYMVLIPFVLWLGAMLLMRPHFVETQEEINAAIAQRIREHQQHARRFVLDDDDDDDDESTEAASRIVLYLRRKREEAARLQRERQLRGPGGGSSTRRGQTEGGGPSAPASAHPAVQEV